MTVLVVGMHRSGTSALTGVLHSIGLPLGDESDLLPADRGNARGYFELLHVNQLNDEILNEWGGSWDTPPVFPADWLESGLAQRQVARIKRIIEQYGLTGAVIKDPRITIILPLWRRALGDEVVAVAMYRSPLEVAQSLSARSSDEFTLGLALWWEYNNAMVRDLGGIRTYLLSYDELTSAPINSSVAMAQQLHKWGVAVNLDAVHDAAGFIDQQLRRERTRATFGNECDELLAVLQAHHGGHPSWPTNETYTALAMPAALLQLRQASRDALVGQVAITNELQSATEELRATVDELNTQVHHWHDEFARVTREYAVLETTTSKRIAHLEQRLSLRLARAAARRLRRG